MPLIMNIPNGFAIAVGVYGIYCGVKNKRGYNDVDAPLTEKERNEPNRPATRLDRMLLIGLGLLMIALGSMGKFS
jgi:hypothetical protein